MEESKEETKYYIAFSFSRVIGSRSFQKLLKFFKKPSVAYHANVSLLTSAIGLKKASAFDSFRKGFEPDSIESLLLSKSIQVHTYRMLHKCLKFVHLFDLPICLYTKGNHNLLFDTNTIFIAIVGTRKPSTYGKHAAELFSRDLSYAGCAIVSGMALGIDTIAHKQCLESGGKTIAVLGSGVDVVYPQSNNHLYNEILARDGLVISEFPPGTPPYASNFVQRNRLITALSNTLLIVEGTKKSGTRTTANFAGEQGKDAFAIPGPITSELSYAPNHFIQNGFHLAMSPQDILFSLGRYDASASLLSSSKTMRKLSDQEKTILDAIKMTPTTSNDLAQKCVMPLSELLQDLTKLEIEGIISKKHDGVYYPT